MTINPLQNGLLVDVDKPKEKSEGGLYIPPTAQEKPLLGTVIAAGPGKISVNGALIDMNVKEGDRILFKKYSGTDVVIDDKEYTLIYEQDVLGIIKNEKKEN